MIRINLLPYELRPIKRTPVPYFLSVLLLLLALAAMGILWQNNSTAIGEMKFQLDSHTNQLEILQPILDEMDELRKQKVILTSRIEVIGEIVKDRIIWSRQLWNISRLAPANVWFSDINLVTRTVQEMVMEPTSPNNPTLVAKKIPVRHTYLVLKGYVTLGDDQNASIYPLTIKLAEDKEFSELFTLYQPRLWADFYNERPVKGFALEYEILPRKGLS